MSFNQQNFATSQASLSANDQTFTNSRASFAATSFAANSSNFIASPPSFAATQSSYTGLNQASNYQGSSQVNYATMTNQPSYTTNQIANDLIRMLASGGGSPTNSGGGRSALASASISSVTRSALASASSVSVSRSAMAAQSVSPSSFSLARLASASSGHASPSYIGSTPGIFLSEIESAILKSTECPIPIESTEELNVLGQRGIWMNKAEIVNWQGELPLCEYTINEDTNPEIVNKRVRQQLEYVQELAIRYLRPPTPPAPGEIVITQQPNILTPPAPPLIIRQQPPRPPTPEPLIIREAPPQPPQPIGQKLITISGKRLPPAPRKVVIERLAPLPCKPQSVIVERWLPYTENIKRRVVFQRAPPDPIILEPRNVIVQWEAPTVSVRQDYKYLGIVRANPAEYVQKYGSSLKVAGELPQFVLDIKNPEGVELAANHRYSSVHELEGDVDALKLIDLDREGLSEYKPYLQNMFNKTNESLSPSSLNPPSDFSSDFNSVESVIEEIFKSIDVNNTGSIDVNEASRVVLGLNSLVGRNYGEKEVQAFFNALDVKGDNTVSLEEFKEAFLSL